MDHPKNDESEKRKKVPNKADPVVNVHELEGRDATGAPQGYGNTSGNSGALLHEAPDES